MPRHVDSTSGVAGDVTRKRVRVRCRSSARVPDSTATPDRMMVTLSQSCSTSARMWLDSSTVAPSEVTRRT